MVPYSKHDKVSTKNSIYFIYSDVILYSYPGFNK